jgi:mannose-6-phosphate isomerase-like protein (cupin superfamily)
VRTYQYSGSAPAWVCGHWNGSPIEIGRGRRTEVGSNEALHHHPYREYYVVIDGEAELVVDGKSVALRAGMVVMIEPGERHMVTAVSEHGAEWIVIKERSEPDSKFVG